jgi:hypothetical protein
VICLSQKPAEKQQSNAELFSQKSGSLLQKGFEPVGIVARCKVQVLHIKDLIGGHLVNALRLEGQLSDKVAVLDPDEVDALIASMQVVKKTIADPAPQYYTEVNCTSRDGFSAGAYCDKGKWTQFIKLEQYGSDALLTMNADDADKFLGFLQAAKEKM